MNLLRLSFLILFALVPATAGAAPALIPMPASLVEHDGQFRITGSTFVEGEGAAAPTAAYLAKALNLE